MRVLYADLVGKSLGQILGFNFPETRKVSVINGDLTEILAIERRVDTPLMFETHNGSHIVVIESQTAEDKTRERSWPYYVSFLNSKYECPVTLLVITADQDTAEWARKPMCIGLADWPTLILRPLVIGPDNAPAVVDAADAEQDIMLAVMSALTHRNDPRAGAILGAIVKAMGTVDSETAEFLHEFTAAGLKGSPAADIWRKLMTTMDLPYKSELREQWNAEGEASGAAKAVLRILATRRLAVSEEVADRIRSTTDIDVLERMQIHAMTVARADELIDG